jgi:hypothetical protein
MNAIKCRTRNLYETRRNLDEDNADCTAANCYRSREIQLRNTMRPSAALVPLVADETRVFITNACHERRGMKTRRDPYGIENVIEANRHEAPRRSSLFLIILFVFIPPREPYSKTFRKTVRRTRSGHQCRRKRMNSHRCTRARARV